MILHDNIDEVFHFPMIVVNFFLINYEPDPSFRELILTRKLAGTVQDSQIYMGMNPQF
jgi:hypothetical protein